MTDNSNNVLPTRKQCPYSEKCYRRNPIHFKEMSHPHLEKLAENLLDGEIKLPENLDFPCTDKDLLVDQLRILQPILRTKRGETGPLKPSSSTSPTSMCNTKNEDLKAKVERNRQAAIARRQARLKELDQQASAVTKNTTTDLQSKPSSSHVDEIQVTEINASVGKNTTSSLENDIEIIDVDSPAGHRGSPFCNQKRSIPSNTKESNISKKLKLKTGSNSSQSRSNQSTSQQSGQDNTCNQPGQSIFGTYSACTNDTSREQVRLKAIEMMKQMTDHQFSIVEPGHFALKYALSAPYHIFFSRIEEIKETRDQPYSIVFPEILDRSLGEIVDSLHTTFILEAGWLSLQYLLAGQNPKMTILYGDRSDTEKLPPNITLHQVTVPTSFGCHHSKISILRYKDDGIRIVVSTANLYSDDWETRSQGVWISPHLPRMPDIPTEGGESPTGFKKDFINYLTAYEMPSLSEWLVHLRSADFSAINVFLVSTVPGTYTLDKENTWGHRKLATILAEHATLPSNAAQWPIIAQSSSIGSLGYNYDSWLGKEIVACMKNETTPGIKSDPPFKFIYPTVKNYKNSLDCRHGSCCLPYSQMLHSKQKWIESYLYQWKATSVNRDKAIPHLKTYTRVSPDLKTISWFVLTSANLSKGAWGYKPKSAYRILNYEIGVVFLPKFVTRTTTFPISEEQPGVPIFRLPYDLPLTKYAKDDTIFTSVM